MYIPDAFRIEDEERARAIIREVSFALLVTTGEGSPQATHLPLLLEGGPEGEKLVGHMARANPQWRSFNGEREALAVFSGPHAYVSPAWYRSAPRVPTWNYVAVHVSGRPLVIEDEARVRALLARLVGTYESPRPAPWRMDLPEDFEKRLLGAITAFEMPIAKIEAKAKLSQNQSAEDRAGVIQGLEAEGGAEARALARLMAAP